MSPKLLLIPALIKTVKAGAITTGLFKVGKGLLSVGKGLKSVGKGLSQGMKSSPKSMTIVQGAKPKISAPKQQDTSQTISPSYYEDPKRQSIFKRTASDGSIESVKITVTNIKSVLFKQQNQLAKQSKNNANLEERLSDLENKKQAGQKLNKQFSKAFSPLLEVASSISSIAPLLMASIIGNMGFEVAKNAEEIGENLTTSGSEKNVNESVEQVGKEETILKLSAEYDEKLLKFQKSRNPFRKAFLNQELLMIKEQIRRLETGERGYGGFFRRKTIKDKTLENLNDTSLIDNDNEVTNTIIINRPIEVPAK